MLQRILEPEVMDSAEEAREYDAMDHAHVNAVFVKDLLDALNNRSLNRPAQRAEDLFSILDLGAGTAQIPIQFARRARHVHITAVDAAQSMLAIAKRNIDGAGLVDRISPLCADAKQLPFGAGSFQVVVSNSIIHHIPEPTGILAEAVRVTASGGLLFHRDLCRPHDLLELNQIVDTYARDANAYQRKLFADSLHAALTVEEMQRFISELGFAADTVHRTSDRHWTWIAANI